MSRSQAKQKPTDRSLASQLKITDREIAYRKSLLEFSDEDAYLLRQCHPTIEVYLDEIVERFYQKQLETNEIALLIGDAETLHRLHQAMRGYILELFQGYYDAEYVNKRLRIGKVHMRIGVSAKLYVAAINQLENILALYFDQCPVVKDDLEAAETVRQSLHKLLLLDIQLVFDTYLASVHSQVETAREELEAYAESLEAVVEERTEQLRRLSTRDDLTGLANQRGFRDQLRREIAASERSGFPIALAYFDLNGFKQINDRKGHLAGDRVLVAVAQVMQGNVREIDIPCRNGGDEFCIIMPYTDGATAQTVCNRIAEAFDELGKDDIYFSMGVAVHQPGSGSDAGSLLARADALMYQAKAKTASEVGNFIMYQDEHDTNITHLSVAN